MKKNYYFDVDGVLALYDRTAYEGDEPEFMKKNGHYFRNLEPDRKMLEVIDRMHQNARYTGDSIYILTSLPVNGAIFNEQMHDKITWIMQWMPYLKIDDILISVTSKRDAVEYIHNHILTKTDVLIDDYNKNLRDWSKVGGTSVKYCNGINSPESFNGTKIYKSGTVDSILTILNSTGI